MLVSMANGAEYLLTELGIHYYWPGSPQDMGNLAASNAFYAD